MLIDISNVIKSINKEITEEAVMEMTTFSSRLGDFPILKKAPILLLDEATSALDMETESRLLTNLMNSGIVKTCILVTHRPAGKQLCNRNYHISDGSVAEVD